MSLSTKILLILGGMLLVGALGFIVYKQIEISNRQQAIETSLVAQKELTDNIMRSQSTYATKADIESFIKENGVNLKAIKDDLAKLDANVTAVNAILVTSQGQRGTQIPTTPGPVNPNPKPVDPNNPDPYGYLARQQNLQLNEDFSGVKVPFGTVGFSAWQEKPWSIDILPREYRVVNVLGTDENQRTYVYNKFAVKSGDKTYDIKIASAETKQEYPEAKFSWWNPRLFVGVDGGVGLNPVRGEFTPSANVGIMSYGRYKTQPDFSILGVGGGYGVVSNRFQLVVTPVTYNVGKHIPLMNNTYVGPSLHVGTDGNVGAMLGLRVGL